MAASLLRDAEIRHAASLLEQGKLVAFPTETVYGLGADAENPAAVADIYRAKGRPQNHPVIVHLAPGADIGYWAHAIPPVAEKLMAAFWPGPLTLILPRQVHIPDAVSGGQNSIGLRCPAHPVALALLAAFKQGQGGVAAPSANRFGHVSPTLAQHVRQEFSAPASGQPDPLIAAILDGGASDVGIESTILDLSRYASHGPILLRPGHISGVQLADILGVMPGLPDAAAPRASGTLESHYAPATPVLLQARDDLIQSAMKLRQAGQPFTVLHYAMPVPDGANGAVCLPAEAVGYAHDLYRALRDMDQLAARVILVEMPPNDATWQGVNDRLRRAAHGSAGVLADMP